MKKITIEVRKISSRRGYTARIIQGGREFITELQSNIWQWYASGRTRAEAVGNLILKHPELFNIEYKYK